MSNVFDIRQRRCVQRTADSTTIWRNRGHSIREMHEQAVKSRPFASNEQLKITHKCEHDGLSNRDASALAGESRRDAGGTVKSRQDASGTSEAPNARLRAALEFCARAEVALWSDAGRAMRVYLRWRGLQDLTILAARLGLHPAARSQPGDAWGWRMACRCCCPPGWSFPAGSSARSCASIFAAPAGSRDISACAAV